MFGTFFLVDRIQLPKFDDVQIKMNPAGRQQDTHHTCMDPAVRILIPRIRILKATRDREGGDLPFGDTVLAVPLEPASERGRCLPPKIETS